MYIHTVVVEVVQKINDIYGGRTSLCLSSNRMPAATSSDCEMIQFYECERNNLRINPYTLHVATTGFFTGELEIYDFVYERIKRCIAAMIYGELIGKMFSRIM